MCDEQVSSIEMWTSLPDIPLETILSFLNRKDQFNLVKALQLFSRQLQFPNDWRSFEFDLTEPMLIEDDCYATFFAEKFGHLFQKVEIEYRETRLVEDWIRHFKNFMQSLTGKSQLTEIYFGNLKDCFEKIPPMTCAEICRVIAVFFGSQTQLKKLHIEMSSFKYLEGIRILRRAIESNRGITCLELQGIKERKDHNPLLYDQILTVILDLPELATLQLDSLNIALK